MKDLAERFRLPDEEAVDRAVATLYDVQHRRVFFGRLENPLWLNPLDARELFQRVADVEDRDGFLFSPPWPEGEYLARIADVFPERVTQILERIGETTNIEAQRAVLACAQRLPAPLAARLVRFIQQYLVQPFSQWLDPEDLAALAQRLLHKGLGRGVDLAEALYFPRSDPQAGVMREAQAGLESYWYARTLPQVAKALVEAKGLQGLKRLCRWLDRYQRVISLSQKEHSIDVSYAWRPSIAPSEQNKNFHELGDALVDAVRDGAAALAQVYGSAPIDELLTSWRQPLFTRLALNFLKYVAGQEHARPLLRERLLSRELLLDYRCRHEYVMLARTGLLLLDAPDQERWLDMAGDGPKISERLRNMILGEAVSLDPDEAVMEYRARWIRDLLGAIGKESLSATARVLLHELQERHGPATEYADFPVCMPQAVWVAPETPFSPEEIMGFEVPALIQQLQEWEPQEEHFVASREGLGVSLRSAVAQDPERFAVQADLFECVHPTYICALFDGLEITLQEGHRFSWEKVLDLVSYVADQRAGGKLDRRPANRDEDLGWASSRKSVVSLLDKALRLRPSVLEAKYAEAIAAILQALLRSENPTAEYEEAYGDDVMDPLTISMNTVRPVAVRAAIRFVSWLAAVDQRPEEDPTGVQILGSLKRLAGPDHEQSLAVHAAFGEGLMTLAHHAPNWTREHLHALLGEVSAKTWRPAHDVVWSTALAAYYPSRALIELLRPFLQARLTKAPRGYTPTPGWRTQESPWELLGRHVIALVANGILEFDDPLLLTFFDRAPQDAVTGTMSHWGWILFRTEDQLNAEFLERCRRLWDWRAESVTSGTADPRELAGFGWWARSGLFEPDWWLPRLQQAATTGIFDIGTGMLKTLAEVAQEYPEKAFDIYNVLVNAQIQRPSYESYQLQKVAPVIIASAMSSDDKALAQRANALMNRLGREGQIALRQEVQKLRKDK